MSELHLGRQTAFPTAYDEGLLQSVPFQGTGDQLVSLTFDEFTSLCPVTGQPDFGQITIHFIPQGKLLESKSLKLYLGSFRNHQIFHEGVVATVFEVATNLLGQVPVEVVGDFKSRGGVKIVSRRSRAVEKIRALQA